VLTEQKPEHMLLFIIHSMRYWICWYDLKPAATWIGITPSTAQVLLLLIQAWNRLKNQP